MLPIKNEVVDGELPFPPVLAYMALTWASLASVLIQVTEGYSVREISMEEWILQEGRGFLKATTLSYQNALPTEPQAGWEENGEIGLMALALALTL